MIVDSFAKLKTIRARTTARPTYIGVSWSIRSLVSFTKDDIPDRYFSLDSRALIWSMASIVLNEDDDSSNLIIKRVESSA